ncbi:hypothetical protein Glove_64g37 [Diversispora epigaea]|uniref:TLDc domain-containing protein n=1 Tax=Diversispora epigaea TaxID=1348612 RepID=A0A397JBW8_9GLOM|nr:hypothetical protein Glove_64g37 [Diversispora epigaea]
MCHGHINTIVIAKVAGTDEIVGGYNPLAWDNSKGGTFMETNDSFIFSLKNGNIQNSILSRVKDSSGALYYPHDKNVYGPWFGFEEFLMETKVSNFTQDKLCQCKYEDMFDNYEKPIRTTSNEFSIVDYEVFKKLLLSGRREAEEPFVRKEEIINNQSWINSNNNLPSEVNSLIKMTISSKVNEIPKSNNSNEINKNNKKKTDNKPYVYSEDDK